MTSNPLYGQGSCIQSYVLDWNEVSTYTVSCGSVNASGWKVSNASCQFSSPVFSGGVTSDGSPQAVDFDVRFNQSGNLDSDDTASVVIYVDNVLNAVYQFVGNNSNAVFTVLTTVMLPSGSSYQVFMLCKTTASNEFWTVKSGDLNICLRSPAPLPVHLVAFDASPASSSGIKLNWATSSEVMNDYYLLWRSTNGTDFEYFTRVKGAGTTSVPSYYSVEDLKPTSGKVYYRLQQTDFNGNSSQLGMVSCQATNNHDPGIQAWLTTQPPAEGPIVMIFSAAGTGAAFNMISLTGQVFLSQRVFLNQGVNSFKLDAKGLLKGQLAILLVTTDQGESVQVRIPILR